MEQINIKDYFQQEKDKLRRSVIIPPSLLIVDATDGDVGNQIYINKKIEDFNSMGWPVTSCKVANQAALETLLQIKKHDEDTDCIIVQLPVGAKFHFSPDMIPVEKDCDGLHPMSQVMPATVRGIIDYLDKCGFEYEGKTAVVLGRSDIVGKPMAKALLSKNMTVVQCHSKTPEGVRYKMLAQADLIVSAVGKPHFIWRGLVHPRAIVIDAGINRDKNNKIVGDFQEQFCNLGGWSTPVPGGVGLLTRLGLMKNCVDLVEIDEQRARLLEDTL